MALSNFDGNLNIISVLDDQPALSASQLKTKFDEGTNLIKTWINSTLIPYINALASGTNLGVKAVKTANIDDGAVTNAQIADGTIAQSKLASAVQTLLGKANTAYQKPSGGVPKTDLASAVQTSLGKADSAMQSIGSGTVTSAMLATQTIIKVSGTAIYGSTLPSSGTAGQIFFKKV